MIEINRHHYIATSQAQYPGPSAGPTRNPLRRIRQPCSRKRGIAFSESFNAFELQSRSATALARGLK